MSPKIGSYQSKLPFAKDLLDFWLTRFPGLYLLVEERREWQNWDKRVYLSVIEAGDTIIDVGANVGAHTIAFSHIAGRLGRVISFEPVPENIERLRQTVAGRSRYPNVVIVESAVGYPVLTDQEVLVKVPGDDFTQGSLKAHSAGSWQNGSVVREYPAALTSIDAQAEGLSIHRLDFMKIDVEGGELDVLKGASATLRRFQPLIYCELYARWADSFGYTPADLFEFIRSLGYTGARVIRDGRAHSMILDGSAPTTLFDASTDVLFFTPRHSARIDRFDQRYSRDHRARREPR
jgi:FkbM family methyltransferase